MAKDPVCGKEIDEAQARAQTSMTRHGASEVDPDPGNPHLPRRQLDLLLRPGMPHKVLSQPLGLHIGN